MVAGLQSGRKCKLTLTVNSDRTVFVASVVGPARYKLLRVLVTCAQAPCVSRPSEHAVVVQRNGNVSFHGAYNVVGSHVFLTDEAGQVLAQGVVVTDSPLLVE